MLSTLLTVPESSRMPARRCDTHWAVFAGSSAINPANNSILANGFLISWASVVDTSASAIALRAASRSCSACLLAVMSRRIQMLSSGARPLPGSALEEATDSFLLPIASQRLPPNEGAHNSMSRRSSDSKTSASKSIWLTAESARRLSTCAFPSSRSLRPSGLIITRFSAVSSTSTPHGIDSMIC